MKNLIRRWRERRLAQIENTISRRGVIFYNLDPDVWPEYAQELAEELMALDLRRSALVKQLSGGSNQ